MYQNLRWSSPPYHIYPCIIVPLHLRMHLHHTWIWGHESVYLRVWKLEFVKSNRIVIRSIWTVMNILMIPLHNRNLWCNDRWCLYWMSLFFYWYPPTHDYSVWHMNVCITTTCISASSIIQYNVWWLISFIYMTIFIYPYLLVHQTDWSIKLQVLSSNGVHL